MLGAGAPAGRERLGSRDGDGGGRARDVRLSNQEAAQGVMLTGRGHVGHFQVAGWQEAASGT